MAALRKFVRAGQRFGVAVELITKDDFARVAEYDALFIRETTRVTDHTFRFARCGEAEGLVVIDDSESIIKCANKVYLAELLAHYRVSTPRTLIVHRDNLDIVGYELGLPCVLKKPDGSFSLGVVKVNTREELEREGLTMLAKSELIIAQEYLPTEFDWRIGVIGNEPLFACRYFMARNSWQIIRRSSTGRTYAGEAQCVPLDETPPEALKLAVRATRHIGSGLYGVDLKQVGKRFYVIEVNDNPNVDAGVEDAVLKDRLYDRIMSHFVSRLEARRKEFAGNGD
jgi:glutathione synthase/RimK-type ligase-like ATP-grasp enzyme